MDRSLRNNVSLLFFCFKYPKRSTTSSDGGTGPAQQREDKTGEPQWCRQHGGREQGRWHGWRNCSGACIW
jgi:hypothetical protein